MSDSNTNGFNKIREKAKKICPEEWARYEEMLRSDQKKEKQRQKREKSYGNDAPIWQHLDTNGNLLDQEEWFIKMPSDALTGELVQAQHQIFKTVAKMRDMPKDSEEYALLLEKLKVQNERVDFIQDILSR